MIGRREERPGVCELVGVAVRASTLVVDPQRQETHLVRVAAMGAASNRIALNLDAAAPLRPGAPAGVLTSVPRDSMDARRLAGAREPSERDAIEARLAPLLWRMKYGGDCTPETAIETVRLFARWLAGTASWQEHPVHGSTAERFCARVLYEWLADKCPACRGTGLQELLRNGMTRSPKRFGDPLVQHVQCRGCQGTRHARPDAMERARVLEVSLALYRTLWAGRMDRAGRQLDRIARRLTKPLRSELNRS
jgi:hypothetical protein